jgi:2-dehydro-3-deoxyphosphooctonate aldolase (KDO 8-P synthase)
MTLKEVKTVEVEGILCGKDPFFLISGPCVIEEDAVMMKTAETLKEISERLKLPVIFKSSFQKDNRSSGEYFRGPSMEDGLSKLNEIKQKFNLPILSDVHHIEQIDPAAKVLDVIQIPAYLCMQTDLVEKASSTGKVINIKHGQFISPDNMDKPVNKIKRLGNEKILLTERGYTFGYNDLIVDPRSFHIMRQIGYPVIFDITHSIRRYGIPSADPKGGNREFLPALGRAGVGAGVDGIFIESHPNPPKAKCDAASQMYLDQLEEYLKPLIEINAIVKGI